MCVINNIKSLILDNSTQNLQKKKTFIYFKLKNRNYKTNLLRLKTNFLPFIFN